MAAEKQFEVLREENCLNLGQEPSTVSVALVRLLYCTWYLTVLVACNFDTDNDATKTVNYHEAVTQLTE